MGIKTLTFFCLTATTWWLFTHCCLLRPASILQGQTDSHFSNGSPGNYDSWTNEKHNPSFDATETPSREVEVDSTMIRLRFNMMWSLSG
jgi:hypothetical protein